MAIKPNILKTLFFFVLEEDRRNIVITIDGGFCVLPLYLCYLYVINVICLLLENGHFPVFDKGLSTFKSNHLSLICGLLIILVMLVCLDFYLR